MLQSSIQKKLHLFNQQQKHITNEEPLDLFLLIHLSFKITECCFFLYKIVNHKKANKKIIFTL